MVDAAYKGRGSHYALPSPICIRIDRFETCPTFSGCRIFIDNRPRYTSFLFNIEIEKKILESIQFVFFLINLRITCNSPSIRWILFLLSIVYFFFFKFKRDEIFFDHSFESNSILTASRSTCTFDGYCFDRFQLSIVFSRFLKKTRDFSMIRVKFLAVLEFLLRFDGYSIVLDCLLFF